MVNCSKNRCSIQNTGCDTSQQSLGFEPPAQLYEAPSKLCPSVVQPAGRKPIQSAHHHQIIIKWHYEVDLIMCDDDAHAPAAAKTKILPIVLLLLL
eukprot:14766668-Alexandrium_andersonii.AAC.1